MNDFAHDLGILTRDVPYEQVVALATRFKDFSEKTSALRRGVSAIAAGRTAGFRRRRAGGGCRGAPRLPRGGAFARAALRHRGGAGEPRADDVHLAQDRGAGAARLSDPENPRRSARAAAVLGKMGGGDLRPDGAHAGPCRGFLLRLRRGAERVCRGRPASSPTTWSRSTSTCATSISTSATRSCRRRSTAASRAQAERPRRSMPAWSKERDDGIVISGAQQLATGGVLSDWLHLSCIHPLQPGDENYANSASPLPCNAPGLETLPAPPFALAARQACSTIRCRAGSTNRQLRGLRQRLRAVGARLHLPQISKSAATSGGRRRRISTATTRRRCATSPSFAS